jgi:hypothetical protein
MGITEKKIKDMSREELADALLSLKKEILPPKPDMDSKKEKRLEREERVTTLAYLRYGSLMDMAIARLQNGAISTITTSVMHQHFKDAQKYEPIKGEKANKQLREVHDTFTRKIKPFLGNTPVT